MGAGCVGGGGVFILSLTYFINYLCNFVDSAVLAVCVVLASRNYLAVHLYISVSFFCN